MEQLGQIVCNRHEEVWISLKEICRRWHIELRIYDRSDDGWRQPRPGRDLINLPVEQLPLLLDRLGQAKDSCVKRGLLCVSADFDGPEERSAAPTQRDRERAAGIRARRYPRLPVRHPAVCQPMPTGELQRSMVLRGEFRDLSVGGAQIWLPCRLELAQRVEVAAMIDGQPFRAKGEIVGADLQSKGDPKTGYIRHSLRWITYNSAATDILTMTLMQSELAASAEKSDPEFVWPSRPTAEQPTLDAAPDRPTDTGAEKPTLADYSREIGRPLGYMLTSAPAWAAAR